MRKYHEFSATVLKALGMEVCMDLIRKEAHCACSKIVYSHTTAVAGNEIVVFELIEDDHAEL